MQRLRAHPAQMTVLAFVISAASVSAIAAAYGFSAFADAWSDLHFGWLGLVVVAGLLAIPTYVVSYRAVVRFNGGPRPPLPLLLRVVIAGFGPFAPGGGFSVDKRALQALEEDDERAARVRVLGLGALEWALLAPAAWLAAVILLASGDRRPMASLLWPWALAVPVGFVLALWLAVPARRKRLEAGGGRIRPALAEALYGVGMLPAMARGLSSCWIAWTGTALYWTLDIAAFYGSLRFIGLVPNLGEAVLGYATGYALTRRSMPLGGAGITEALMTFSLHWVGLPIAPALAAVVVYRLFNFALPAVPALLVRRRLRPLLAAADEERPPTRRERRYARAPLGQPQR